MKFPIIDYSEFPQQVLDGYTLYKSSRKWHALVVLKNKFGTQVKLYSWKKTSTGWKVGLANMNISFWKVSLLNEKYEEFKNLYL